MIFLKLKGCKSCRSSQVSHLNLVFKQLSQRPNHPELKAPSASHLHVSTSLFSSRYAAGCTWEFASMVGYIKRAYPQTQLIVVGFSLGGNIVCKFLGENSVNQERVLCCVSVCQGYSALRWVVRPSVTPPMFDVNTPRLNIKPRIDYSLYNALTGLSRPTSCESLTESPLFAALVHPASFPVCSLYSVTWMNCVWSGSILDYTSLAKILFACTIYGLFDSMSRTTGFVHSVTFVSHVAFKLLLRGCASQPPVLPVCVLDRVTPSLCACNVTSDSWQTRQAGSVSRDRLEGGLW